VDEKYVVFKREDWQRFIEVEGTMLSAEEPLTPLDDAVVIRTQDSFAAAGLSAYAHQIRGFINVCKTPGVEVATYDRDNGTEWFEFSNKLKELEAVADYFNSVAQEAEHRLEIGECKLPD
jgi:hypothetical protein